MNVKKEFETVKQLVLHVLEHHEETRDNDNKLFVRCAEYLGGSKLSDLEDMGLNLITVYKNRQQIQNKLGLYLPSEEVKNVRTQRQKEIREIMAS